jgi:NADH:ubiquinone reductase (H+-translocating)
MRSQSLPHRHEVVVVGGGYAGTLAAIRLAGRTRRHAHVTLVDADGALVQRLRLHQVAAGQDVRAAPLHRLTGPAVDHVHGRATRLDLRAARVRVAAGGAEVSLPYDTLILATGSTIDVESVPGVARHAHRLADTAAAQRLNAALGATPPGGVVAVVGGGMTGLEAATEIAEARPDLRVRLFTAGALGDWLSPAGRAYLARALDRLGVEVVEHERVTAVEPQGLVLASGADAGFELAVWCGGFVAPPVARAAGLATDGRGRVLVDATLRAVSHPEVLAVGDAAAVPRQRSGAAVRMTCQAGMPTGAHAADVVAATLRGREPAPFDFGYVHQPISLGRRDALIQWVDRADVAKPTVLTGPLAARYKNLVSASPMPTMRLERRFPGSMRWLRSGEPHPAATRARDAAAA